MPKIEVSADVVHNSADQNQEYSHALTIQVDDLENQVVASQNIKIASKKLPMASLSPDSPSPHQFTFSPESLDRAKYDAKNLMGMRHSLDISSHASLKNLCRYSK